MSACTHKLVILTNRILKMITSTLPINTVAGGDRFRRLEEQLWSSRLLRVKVNWRLGLCSSDTTPLSSSKRVRRKQEAREFCDDRIRCRRKFLDHFKSGPPRFDINTEILPSEQGKPFCVGW